MQPRNNLVLLVRAGARQLELRVRARRRSRHIGEMRRW